MRFAALGHSSALRSRRDGDATDRPGRGAWQIRCLRRLLLGWDLWCVGLLLLGLSSKDTSCHKIERALEEALLLLLSRGSLAVLTKGRHSLAIDAELCRGCLH